MTDLTQTGSETTGNPSAAGVSLSSGSESGTQSPSQTPSGAGGGGDTWSAALSKDNQTLVANKGWTNPDDALKAYRELETFQGRAVALPGKDATEADWKAFHRKIGTPEKPEGYEIKVAEGVDAKAVDGFKTMAHELGLNPRQAQGLYDKLAGVASRSQELAKAARIEREQTALRAAQEDLSKAWGPEKGEMFQRKTELARRAIQELGGDPLFADLRKAGVLTETNGVLNAPLIKVFSEIGEQLFSEGSFINGGNEPGANPWDEKTLNLTEQGRLVRQDPARARAFIRAAGKRAADYGLSEN